MRILLFSHYFWPESFPINDLCLGLQERGHQVTVVCPLPNYPEGEFYPGYGLRQGRREEFHGVEVIRVPVVPRGNGRALRMALNYVSSALFECIEVLRLWRRDFDLVFVYQPSPVTTGLAGWLRKQIRGTPVLFWVQDLWPETLSATGFIKNPILLGAVGLLVRLLYRDCDRLLIQSHAFRAPVEKMGVSPEQIVFFPNSADAFYQPVEVPSEAPERALLPEGFRIMYAGNLGAAQDFETMLDAAEKLRHLADLRWILLGHGRKAKWLEEEVRRRGLEEQVHLLGRHPKECMPTFLSLAEALLVTLRKDPIFELTVPSKVQPYMACGKPILAILEGEGARLLQEAGAGYSSHPGDAAGLVENVERLYQADAEGRAILGRASRKFFLTHFERGKLFQRLEGWMEEVAGNSSRGKP
jgi:glycosyltransferase involved in cell wall biosynthesis